MKLVTWFKTPQDVERYLQAAEKKWWVLNWWTYKPTEWNGWKSFFEKYQEKWWFCIIYWDNIEFSPPVFHCFFHKDYYLKKYPSAEYISFEDAIRELEGKPNKEKTTRHTYTTQHIREDWIVFTRDTINGKTIQELKDEEQACYKRAREIRGLLTSHANRKF